MLDMVTARSPRANDRPDVAEETRELNGMIKAIRKLRWIGREDEARALELALHHWPDGSRQSCCQGCRAAT